jgi:hypothetical protein
MRSDSYLFIPNFGRLRRLDSNFCVCSFLIQHVFLLCSKDGTKTTTLIKKVKGDREAFIRELRAVLDLPVPVLAREDALRIRVGGTIEVDGNHVRVVKEWLSGLGF